MHNNSGNKTDISKTASDDMTYEKAMERLSEIVSLLEGGKLSLDESVKLFEEGARLSAYCDGCLKEAELTVKKLSEISETEE